MRFVVLAAVIALVLAACGDDDETVADDTTTTSTTEPATATTSTTALADGPQPAPAPESISLDADIDSRLEAGPVTWTIEVTNDGDEPVTVTFPTSQPGDAVILDGDTEVHRWSSGRFFAQAIEERTVPADDSIEVSFEDDLSGIEPGYYDIRLSLAVVGPPEPVTDQIRIVEP